MPETLERLANQPLVFDGPVTRMFRAAGSRDFAEAAHHVLRLPYGRIADRSKFWLVLEERRGTCTTKHALLAELAHEQGIAVQLMLGIYEMNQRNTPGVGRVLQKYGLSYIPEAHCYLRYQGERIDVTGVPPGGEPIERFLHEEVITVDQIGAYKNELHRIFLADRVALQHRENLVDRPVPFEAEVGAADRRPARAEIAGLGRRVGRADVDLLRGVDADRRHVRPAGPLLPGDREAEPRIEVERALQ